MSRHNNLSIPLLCNLCPKTPTFSDISHLLTHVSSKTHLANKFRLQILSNADFEVANQLKRFETWYAENNIAGLLSERLAGKDTKKQTRRVRALAGTSGHRSTIKKEIFIAPAPASNIAHGLPKLHNWPAGPSTPIGLSEFPEYLNETSMYATPTAQRHLPNFGPLPSPSFGDLGSFLHSPLKLEETVKDPGSDATKLKGIYWPGMDLFDSATPEMQRKRNQRKDESVLEILKIHSAEVMPTELVFNASGDLERTRDIFDSPTNSSPFKSEPEAFQSPKRRRPRNPKRSAPLAAMSTNAPRLDKEKRLGKSLRRSTRHRATNLVTGDDRLNTLRLLNPLLPNVLGVDEMSFAPTVEEDEEFRLIVGDLGKQKKMAIFRDDDAPNRSRTESPLEENGFGFNHSQEQFNFAPYIASCPGQQSSFENESTEAPNSFRLSPLPNANFADSGPFQLPSFSNPDIMGCGSIQLPPYQTQVTAEGPLQLSPFRIGAIMANQKIHFDCLSHSLASPSSGLPQYPFQFEYNIPNPLMWNNFDHTVPIADFQTCADSLRLPAPDFDFDFPINNSDCSGDFKPLAIGSPLNRGGEQQTLPNMIVDRIDNQLFSNM